MSIGGGVMLVDGERFGTCDVTPSGDCEAGIYGPGHVLDFDATFTGDTFQHSGLGVKLEAAPWAIFSTGSDGTFYARTNNGVNPESITLLGPGFLSTPHRFRIDWEASTVTYSIDGVVVARRIR